MAYRGDGGSLLIDPAREREAAGLLRTKTLSNREIARRTRVSRSTVGAMASGRRPMDYSARCVEARLQPGDRVESTEEGRCGECGGLVMLPCRACRLRGLLHAARRRPGTPDPTEPLTMALKDEDLARYEMVRRQKTTELLREVDPPDAPDELDLVEPTESELREIDTDEESR